MMFWKPSHASIDTAPASHRALEAAHAAAPDEQLAWACVAVACLGFGCCYLPVKGVDVRDGKFFNLWFTFGIMLVGAAQWAAMGMYRFEPMAMTGGAIWATGNLFVPFIVRSCGLGVGQLVWGSTNMLTGWATGTFGLFGIEKSVVADPHLNYYGVLLSVFALLLISLVKDEQAAQSAGKLAACGKSASPRGRFLMGFVAALFAGVLFGCNFNPPTLLQQQGRAEVAAGLPAHHSTQAMDYVVSHFAGVFLFTLTWFFVVSVGDCYLGWDVALPGLFAGGFWAVAQICWFQANATLSFSVAFPVICGVPGVLATLLAAGLFGENRGCRNLSLLSVVVVLQFASLLCIAQSRGAEHDFRLTSMTRLFTAHHAPG